MAVTTNFQDIPHLKYKIYLKVENVDGFIRHQVVMLLYVSKVPIVVCLTSAGPKILTEVETFGERCQATIPVSPFSQGREKKILEHSSGSI